MRLFLAVDLDSAGQRGVATAISKFRHQCESSSRDLAYALRWSSPDTLHITLHFLGEVDRGRLPLLRTALTPPIRLAPFEIEFGNLGIISTGGLSRLVRLDVASGADGLTEVHRELARRLVGAGFAVDSKPFEAHLTLARLKSPGSVDLGSVLSSRSIDPIGRCKIDHATLYRSQPSPLGSIYGSILRVTLER
ncbi:MAG: RNA 2',3'-cyclic phosphodiesterase [Acidobacteriota bacterium]